MPDSAKEREHRGSDVAIYVPVQVDGQGEVMTKVAARRGLELEETTDTIDGSHADNYPVTKRLPGKTDWNTSFDGVVLLDDVTGSFNASQRALQLAVRNRRRITIVIRYASGPIDHVDEGQAIPTNFTFAGDFDGEATYSVELEAADALDAEGLVFSATAETYSAGSWTPTAGSNIAASNGNIGEQPTLDKSGDFPFIYFDGSKRLHLDDRFFQRLVAGFTIAGVARIDTDKNHTLIGGGGDGSASEIDLDTQDSADRLSLRIGSAPVISSPPGSIVLGEFFEFLIRFAPGDGRLLQVGTQRTEDDTANIGWENGSYAIGAESGNSYMIGAFAALDVYRVAINQNEQRKLLNRYRTRFNL